MRKGVLLLPFALAFACGQKKAPTAPPQEAKAPAQAEQQAPPPAPPPAPAPSAEDLQKKRKELQTKIADLEKSVKEMEARHEEEKKGLPDLGLLRRTYTQAIIDARSKELELQRLLERKEELKRFAESAARGKLKELREERAKIAERQDTIQDAWRKSAEEAALGAVEESPVKRDLETIRAVKQQWFVATPVARRGAAKESERKIINDGFRGWLGEAPDRKRVVTDVLALPQAPKGKTADSYDYSDLKFFILLELKEEQLERQNIAVEKKELTENRDKLSAIQAELDGIDEKIHEQMVAGGDELQEYEDLTDRLPTVQQAATYLSTRVVDLKETLTHIDEMRERQNREEDEVLRQIDQAKRDLSALR
jgi:chromosome segregation ATPase